MNQYGMELLLSKFSSYFKIDPQRAEDKFSFIEQLIAFGRKYES
jgi:hypothetical protein